MRTDSIQEPISKEFFALRAVLLRSNLFTGLSIFMDVMENVLGNFGVFLSCCASKNIEINIKPFVDSLVNSMVMITNFLGSLSFFGCSCFSSSSILVCATNINDVVTNLSKVACLNIS
jgi:hypothetical protein